MIDYEAEEVVKYIFSRLRCVYDRRKAALLAFLAQYEVGRRNVYELMCGGRHLARARFYIGCGVVSDEVYEALRSGGFERPPEEVCTYAACYCAYTPVPELCYSGPAPQLPRPVEDRLSDVLNQFGNWSYQRPARYVDRLLLEAATCREEDKCREYVHTCIAGTILSETLIRLVVKTKNEIPVEKLYETVAPQIRHDIVSRKFASAMADMLKKTVKYLEIYGDIKNGVVTRDGLMKMLVHIEVAMIFLGCW